MPVRVGKAHGIAFLKILRFGIDRAACLLHLFGAGIYFLFAVGREAEHHFAARLRARAHAVDVHVEALVHKKIDHEAVVPDVKARELFRLPALLKAQGGIKGGGSLQVGHSQVGPYQFRFHVVRF